MKTKKYLFGVVAAVLVVGGTMFIYENVEGQMLPVLNSSTVLTSSKIVPMRGNPIPVPINVCFSASPSVVFANPPTGSTSTIGSYLPVAWTWNTIPAVQTSLYLVPQTGSPILFSQYSTATNITTNGTMSVSPTRGGDVYGIIPSNVPAGQYQMEVVSGTNTLIGCSGTFILVAPQVCSSTPSYMEWGTNGIGNGQFNYPRDITTDSSGSVYVVDEHNNRIQKFSPRGGYVIQWGNASGNGQLQDPTGIAVGSLGNLYVLDNNVIKEYTPSGTYITQWMSPWPVSNLVRIATDFSGNVYVVDNWLDDISEFTSSGTFIKMFGWGVTDGTNQFQVCTSNCAASGISGTGNGQFKNPFDIAVDASGNIYITDSTNERIQKFTSSGAYSTQWRMQGNVGGQFTVPVGIDTDSSRNVYVTDNSGRVQEFTNTGVYIRQLGNGGGSGNQQFIVPQGITVDVSGNTYVVDTGNNRIQKFGPIDTCSLN